MNINITYHLSTSTDITHAPYTYLPTSSRQRMNE